MHDVQDQAAVLRAGRHGLDIAKAGVEVTIGV